MASGSGAWIFSDDWQARVTVNVANLNATTARVTIIGYIYNNYATASNFSAAITNSAGGGTGSYSVGYISEGSGLKRINSSDITIDIARGSTSKTFTGKCTVYGSGIYAGYSSTASATVTIDAISYSKPNAPSGLTATYVSDASTSLAWTNGSTDTTHPRNDTVVERSIDGGAWVQIAAAASSATNYADNGTEPNRKYTYRIAARNSAGMSAYATSGDVYTSPAAPTGVTASKLDASTVQVDATEQSPYSPTYDVERTLDNGATWTSVTTGASLPVTDAPGGGTVAYRVRAVLGGLASPWALSNSLVTITPPLAPTISTRPGAVVTPGTVTIGWSPNHPDGSAQAKAQVSVTDPGGTTTVQNINGPTTSTTVASNALGVWTVQVRTFGLDPNWGAWSETITWRVANPPSVAITDPPSDGTVIAAMPLDIAWTVTDPSGVSAQTVTVTGPNGTVYSGSTLASALRFEAGEIALANGLSYTITIKAVDGYGLQTTATRTFGVSWTPPVAPTVTVEDIDGSASILVGYGTGGVTTVSATVQRVNRDGTLWTVAANVPDGGTAVDPLPPLGVPVEYIVTASAASGATTVATFTETFGGSEWALNFGPAAQDAMTLVYNPDASYSLEQGGASYHFADGGAGGGRPVFYATADRDENGSLRFDTVGASDADRLRELCDRYPVAWLRDPFGHRWRALVRPSWSHGRGNRWQLSLSWDSVRFEEAW